MILTNTPPEKKDKLRIKHDITYIKFIHNSYIEIARNIFQNPYLFYHKYNSYELKKNQRDTYDIIKHSIEQTIRKILPMNVILQNYTGNSFNNNTDDFHNTISDVDYDKLKHLLNNDNNDNDNNSNKHNNNDVLYKLVKSDNVNNNTINYNIMLKENNKELFIDPSINNLNIKNVIDSEYKNNDINKTSLIEKESNLLSLKKKKEKEKEKEKIKDTNSEFLKESNLLSFKNKIGKIESNIDYETVKDKLNDTFNEKDKIINNIEVNIDSYIISNGQNDNNLKNKQMQEFNEEDDMSVSYYKQLDNIDVIYDNKKTKNNNKPYISNNEISCDNSENFDYILKNK